MPTYDYRCQYCGKNTEVRLSMAEIGKTIVACTGCDHNMKRRYTPPAGIHFRGSGWASKGG